MPPDEARVEALESLYAHQERAIQELSDLVAAQWARIDGLTREVLRLRDELQTVSERVAPDRPPPHY
ncbi:SlyX protein [Rhodoblastus acidophilus]|uniref:SlyX family protein n=1 Tax=Rhodoblastus acidophilus TaxID=1074 RepID=UPI002223FCAB|nr:SlyX family protein [Rhodoblastus acidophilus]MCW2282462.1 SlyX protein [Rhodoblastus acidophilus]MCW2331133.1 SlyX protein [Rhodoblastus acidophilus]